MGFIRTSLFVALLSIVAYGVYEHQTRGIKFADPTLPAMAQLPPWPLYNLGVGIGNTLQSLSLKTSPPFTQVTDLATAFWMSTAIMTFAKLDIGDALREPHTCEEAALLVPHQPIHTPFFCRFLAGTELLGLVTKSSDGKYQVTDAGLMTTKEGLNGQTFRDFIFMVNEEHADSLYALPKMLQTGQNGMMHVYGQQWWPYLSEHPENSRQFDRAMQQISSDMLVAIAGDVSFANDTMVCDIGGGRGHVLAGILKHYPNLKGKLFDVAETVEHGRTYMDSIGMSDRVTVVPGSFFEGLQGLEDCSTFIMKHIVHDWSDEDSIKILSNVRKVMKPDSRLLLAEFVLQEDLPLLERIKRTVDFVMMALCPSGAKERTRQEYAALGEKAGMEYSNFYKTRSILALVELKPSSQ
eukprot:TRINITY_DN2907_c2_g1::TRINITY_DN2907_c2_g1_i1::g.4134::m.4134 TRINITY_DN2907_c2_g1::TRINITY_DN2907_c2_g1_i1::g.4134  ORF type:complete len:427 (+),score=96.37,sp/Q9X5T6/MMCR_STRLA/30.97/7e-32,Methyltransf_2/PF00891.13/6.4e-46,Methyltransf_18/PF12847.2/0.00029,Methyltransf_31/PF13847.1/0.00085,Methyltransf_12/PF08242.7/6.8e+03,Methyltransf_12/PF08242.7/0.021,Methyltransf_25/PF13649.1/0.036,Methyltransf_25/PF13649.1/5e+03 TRINITY_DN2907_c2_g1_i1:56-1282(+)